MDLVINEEEVVASFVFCCIVTLEGSCLTAAFALKERIFGRLGYAEE